MMRRSLLVAAVILFTAACGGPNPDGPSDASVSGAASYQVTGTAKHVSITYQNASGGTSQTGASLPWGYALSAKGGDFLYVSAQIDQSPDSGSITVTIMKGTSVYETAHATGFPNIATASGSY
jgi:hypothetical protein